MYRNCKSFTLIELLVVVAIIGILAAVGTPIFQGFMYEAKCATIKENHNSMKDFITTNVILHCETDFNKTFKLKDFRHGQIYTFDTSCGQGSGRSSYMNHAYFNPREMAHSLTSHYEADYISSLYPKKSAMYSFSGNLNAVINTVNGDFVYLGGGKVSGRKYCNPSTQCTNFLTLETLSCKDLSGKPEKLTSKFEMKVSIP